MEKEYDSRMVRDRLYIDKLGSIPRGIFFLLFLSQLERCEKNEQNATLFKTFYEKECINYIDGDRINRSGNYNRYGNQSYT